MRNNRDKNGAPVGSVLVVGGGIAGMQSALDLASSGFLVHMVTDEPSIGGKMVRLDKTFPTNDCAMCLLGPKMTDCQGHPNIRIHTRSSLKALEGDPGRFLARIEKSPRYVKIEECTACGECEAVCPVEVSNSFNMGMNKRKAIYKLFPQSVPNAYLIEKRGKPPCRVACPAGCNAQGYVALISQGKFKEALEVIRRTIPFPGICGRICHHPCEGECNRSEYDDPVAIHTLKRAAADYGWSDEPDPRIHEAPEREEKVAVIGAGPGGLTAAYDLALKGYKVTVFDRHPWPGGMMMAAIPRYRLSKDEVQREAGYLLKHGIEFRPNTAVGVDVTLEGLSSEGYKAILIATGTPRSRMLNIEGAGAQGIVGGLDFLRDINLGNSPKVGRRVLIIGGGNVAMDTARSALRLGASEVHVACLEARHEMPAHEWEIEEALDEGIILHNSWGPKNFVVEDGAVRGVVMRRVSSVFDEDGRFNPKFIEGTEKTFEADQVIVSIGQASDLSFVPDALGVEVSRGGTIIVDPVTMATSAEGVFACGDVVTGPASVVEAIAGGHEAAISIDRYLRGEDMKEGRIHEKPARLDPPTNMPVLAKRRLHEASEDAGERKSDFREVLLGYTPEEAIEEAKRCLNCGICSECLQCAMACKKNAVYHEDGPEMVELEVGAVILAPGFDLYELELHGQYGYGLYPNVVTSIEFERLLSSTGPTQGEVKRPSDGNHPRRIAFIQCVGSRDATCGAEYCSSICCMYSTKEAVIAREHDSNIEATIFYLDMRSFGKNFDRYVESAKANYGVRYVRSFISAVKEDPRTGNLRIKYYSGGQIHEEEFDLVVLAVGVRPPRATKPLAEATGIVLNEYGYAWAKEFDPTCTSREGVFVAGAFQGPRDIPETVMNASAAAANAAAYLSPARGTMVTSIEYPPERDVSGEEPRVGVFVCRCGINIASVVDVPAVVEYAATLPGVVHAQESLYTCSQDTLNAIKEVIREKKLNRVVVSSCTIRTHQPLFREALRQAGLNQFLFEMANIRDQCSWVHRDEPELATEKAKDLVRMAVAKVRSHEPLHLHPVPVVQKALVIGGGIAGMTAALSLADQGYETFLVEREQELGGNLRRVRYTLEGADMRVLLQDTIHRVLENPLIHVYTGARIEDFSGHAGHFVATISWDGQNVQLEHGVVLVATGGQEYTPPEYLYGQHPRVMSLLELEAKLHDAPSEISGWKDVVIIGCVGSRDDERRYCSRTCCAQSVKNALLLKDSSPGMRVFVLYRDMRTYGFMERFYKEAWEKGVMFIPFDDDSRPMVELSRDGSSNQLLVKVTDASSGAELEIEADAVVLASATVPSEGTAQLASALKVPTNEDGFFLETHIKLAPIDFPSQGIFLCGAAHSPKFITESIYQAQGAVARAATILSRKNLMVGGVVAVVDDSKCAACLTCVRVCPYSVPLINERNVAEINPVQCQGCGSCAAECPAKAISLQHYKDEQIAEKIRGLFAEVN